MLKITNTQKLGAVFLSQAKNKAETSTIPALALQDGLEPTTL